MFTEVDLDATDLTSETPGVREQIAVLYQRLLARDPTTAEVAAVATLANATTGYDFAVLACLAIGTTTEKVLL